MKTLWFSMCSITSMSCLLSDSHSSPTCWTGSRYPSPTWTPLHPPPPPHLSSCPPAPRNPDFWTLHRSPPQNYTFALTLRRNYGPSCLFWARLHFTPLWPPTLIAPFSSVRNFGPANCVFFFNSGFNPNSSPKFLRKLLKWRIMMRWFQRTWSVLLRRWWVIGNGALENLYPEIVFKTGLFGKLFFIISDSDRKKRWWTT